MKKHPRLSDEHKSEIIGLYNQHTVPEILEILFQQSGITYTDQQVYSYVRTFKRAWVNTIEELKELGRIEEAKAASLKLQELLPSKREEQSAFYQGMIQNVLSQSADAPDNTPLSETRIGESSMT
ncbi:MULTISPECIES: hypothetical protein [unclassified Thiocapsa]|uniref:hypothetical protein n=1 Tax=unclassified Thiocapsa TaxID=2641286 RepID=UPI0035ADA629